MRDRLLLLILHHLWESLSKSWCRCLFSLSSPEKALIIFTCNFWTGFTEAQGSQVTCLSVTYQKVGIRAMMSLQLLCPLSKGGVVVHQPGTVSVWETPAHIPVAQNPRANCKKMTAGLCFHQGLAFESFLGSRVFQNRAIPCGLGDSPHGMLQPKHSQSLVPGRVVAWDCSLSTGVFVWVLRCSWAGQNQGKVTAL